MTTQVYRVALMWDYGWCWVVVDCYHCYFFRQRLIVMAVVGIVVFPVVVVERLMMDLGRIAFVVVERGAAVVAVVVVVGMFERN